MVLRSLRRFDLAWSWIADQAKMSLYFVVRRWDMEGFKASSIRFTDGDNYCTNDVSVAFHWWILTCMHGRNLQSILPYISSLVFTANGACHPWMEDIHG